ncbi:MAG: hypothetical protein R3E14_12640 [Erythrobacter sp.]
MSLRLVGKSAILAGLASAAALTGVAAADRGGVSVVRQWPFGIGKARSDVAAAIEDSDGAKALDAGKRLVSQAPLRRSNLSLLATAYLLAGNAQTSADTFRVASSLGWRDELAQGNAVSLALSNGEYAIAASRMEALVRAEPQSQVARQLLIVISEVPASRAALGAAMAAGAGWGDNLVSGLHELPVEEIAARIPILRDAYASGFRATELLARRETDRIYTTNPALGWDVWTALSGPGGIETAGLWDADFTTIEESAFAGRAPFEWRREKRTTQTLSVKEDEGQVLLTVRGRNFSAENIVNQHVRLAPGRYLLGWAASAASSDRPDLLLSADCAQPARTMELGPAIREQGSFYRLLVVARGCDLTQVRVFAPTGGTADRWIANPRVLPIN